MPGGIRAGAVQDLGWYPWVVKNMVGLPEQTGGEQGQVIRVARKQRNFDNPRWWRFTAICNPARYVAVYMVSKGIEAPAA